MTRNKRHKRTHRTHTKGRRVAQDTGSRGTGRLVLCGAVFVLLVAIKLLFPSYAALMTQKVGGVLNRDTDFQAVFSAVGRAVGGEGDALRDAYVAVFHPDEEDGAVEVSGSGLSAVTDTVQTLARYTALPMPESTTVAGQLSATESAEAAVVLRDSGEDSQCYAMASLPEDASLTQLTLPFSYTTPVVGTLSSAFGWRQHPVVGEELFHYGVDLAAKKGTDICAFADGEVFAIGESSTLGKYIMLTHEGGYRTLYAHCSRVSVSSGCVAIGQKIGEVGETGRATGPHLHFELQFEGVYYNPIYYLEIG